MVCARVCKIGVFAVNNNVFALQTINWFFLCNITWSPRAAAINCPRAVAIDSLVPRAVAFHCSGPGGERAFGEGSPELRPLNLGP